MHVHQGIISKTHKRTTDLVLTLILISLSKFVNGFIMVFIKGGCALYGHSCYGGHGKRSEPQISNDDSQYSLNSFRSDPNKELRVNIT